MALTYTTPQDGSLLDTLITNVNWADYSANTVEYVGEYGGAIWRTILKVPSLLTLGKVNVNSASLNMYVCADYANNASTFGLYRLKRDVVIPQVTWGAYSSGNAWQTNGATGANDYDSTAIAAVYMPADTSGWKTWNITASAMTEIINGGWPSPSFLIASSCEYDSGYQFCSSNYSDPAYRPYITINYNPLPGGETVSFLSDFGMI